MPKDPYAGRELLRVVTSADIGAAAATVYRLIADYKNGHPHIVPPKYFRNLEVLEGGYGAGTAIAFDVLAFGKVNPSRARVTEPEPGRILTEADAEQGVVTTFTVEPISKATSRVTISTDFPTRTGLLGPLERMLVRGYLGRVHAAELALIDEQARKGIIAAA